MAVVRLIDVEHLLHRFAGQADFLADHFGAVGLFHLDQGELNLIGFIGVDLRISFRKRPEHGFIALSPVEFLCFLANLLLSQTFHVSYRSHCV